MIGSWASVASADPTKLVFAEEASHVVASLSALDLSFANGAEGYAARLGDVPFEALCHGIFATEIRVPFVSTLEADNGGALLALKLLAINVACFHPTPTACLGAPAH